MITFSVIIPLYNKELSVEATLNSVLAQCYPHFEIIVVNDGSTDNSLSVVESIKDSRIRIVNTENRGVSSARNTGVEYATTDYIVFLDADDLWYPYCLEEFSFLIKNYTEASVFCTSHTLDIKNIPSSDKRYYVDNFYKATAESYARNVTALLCTGCAVVKKDAFLSTGGYNKQLRHGEDLDMWERLAEKYIYAKSEVVTMKYRLDAENRSDKTRKNKKNSIKQVVRKTIIDKCRRLDYGRIYFFQIYNNIVRRQNWKESLVLFSKYGDWIFSFTLLIIKIRIQNRLFGYTK